SSKSRFHFMDKTDTTPQRPQNDSNSGTTSSDPLYTVVTRNEFYRDGFRKLMGIAIVEGIAIIVMVLTLIVFIQTHQTQDRFFATTADGRIMRLVPLDEPNLISSALVS